MKPHDRYVCWVPCKPYVKQFLLQNYNDPDENWPEIISLSSDKELQTEFLKRLSKVGRWENKYKDLKRYSDSVAIEIRKDTFYRYGWSLSNSEVVQFGVIVERKIKTMLFLYLDTNVSMGVPLSTAIRNFQSRFAFSEEIWSYDTIRREYNRHSYKKINTTDKNIFDFIHEIILGKLSENGTISRKAKQQYEIA
ncbi:hypothetical protein [Phocaeicola paurosaccharolyticus]|mgnify:CR=1 FL=1|uniref:hypothetical protein n=1 Tax=Phocaeicola paurosaccharolyticus TaxID=732242 RepID=UPI002FE2E681